MSEFDALEKAMLIQRYSRWSVRGRYENGVEFFYIQFE